MNRNKLRLARQGGLMTGMRRDHVAGLLLVIMGVSVVWECAGYGYGTLDRMGPGLFPTALGVALTCVGLLVAMTPGEDGDHDPAMQSAPDWRGWFCIIGGVALFIVLGDYFGLGPATFACVLVSALGDRAATIRGALLLAVGCTAVAAFVFSMVLHFQLPLLRW